MERAPVARASGVASIAVLVALAAIAGCVPDVVRWDEGVGSGPALRSGARLDIGPDGAPVIRDEWTAPATPEGMPVCAATLTAARARGDTAFAVWWAPRANGAADLVVARSDDRGRSWRQPVVADSTDRAHTGCAREPPSIATDSLNGYVHVVYFLVGAEGSGLFSTHSMEGGAMFHAPVPIVYGERPSAAAVASWGDAVAVAYQDPNSSVPQIWLALSRTTGHIFEGRASVSSASASATHPVVAVRGGRVAVAWLETARGGGASTTVIRTGTIRR